MKRIARILCLKVVYYLMLVALRCYGTFVDIIVDENPKHIWTIYRSVVNSPSHCATPLGNNFKKETVYKIYMIDFIVYFD